MTSSKCPSSSWSVDWTTRSSQAVLLLATRDANCCHGGECEIIADVTSSCVFGRSAPSACRSCTASRCSSNFAASRRRRDSNYSTLHEGRRCSHVPLPRPAIITPTKSLFFERRREIITSQSLSSGWKKTARRSDAFPKPISQPNVLRFCVHLIYF